MISDIVRYHKIRYIKILYPYPEFLDRYRDIVSRQNISRYRTQFFAQLAAPSLVHQESKSNYGYLAVELKQ